MNIEQFLTFEDGCVNVLTAWAREKENDSEDRISKIVYSKDEIEQKLDELKSVAETRHKHNDATYRLYATLSPCNKEAAFRRFHESTTSIAHRDDVDAIRETDDALEKMLKHTQIDDGRKLIDVDDKNLLPYVEEHLDTIEFKNSTPNGYHIVTKDEHALELLDPFPDVDVLSNRQVYFGRIC